MQSFLTAGNVVSIGSQTHKVLLIDVTLKGAQAVRFVDVPQLQLTVRRTENSKRWKGVMRHKTAGGFGDTT